MENSSPPPDDMYADLRRLSHQLSNALETILQAAYLLGEAKLEDKEKNWTNMIDRAARDAARINREIRDGLSRCSGAGGRASAKINQPTPEP